MSLRLETTLAGYGRAAVDLKTRMWEVSQTTTTRRYLKILDEPEPWLDHLALDIPADLAAAVAADRARQPLRAAVAVVVAVASNTRRYR